MMRQFAYALLIGLGIVSSAVAKENLEPIGELPLDKGEAAFLIEDGEATVDDILIRRIAVGRDKVTASYRNKGEEAKRPRYTLCIYNQYGFLLGEKTVGETVQYFGGVGVVEPGEVATEEITIEWLPLERIIKKSQIELPSDWQTAKWIVIAESNTTANNAADRDDQ